jgi:hypothetical protein
MIHPGQQVNSPFYAGTPYCVQPEMAGGRGVANRDKFADDYKALIARLVQHRRDAGVTQAAVAVALGTDQSQVSKLERGERRLDIIDYVRYCRAIGIDPRMLLPGSE